MNANEDGNMTTQDIHNLLKADAAYALAMQNQSVIDMCTILRAHGLPHTLEAACQQLEVVA